ncbi:MAG: DUF4190 domain-containing protein [Clostridia bacterium]|nr:DUF4190 domain-containing protein [Clostridia bacterium]
MYNSYYPSYNNDLESSITFIVVISILALILNIVATVICGIMAARKERSVGGWIVGGIFLSWIALIILACLPSNASEYRGNTGYTPIIRKYQPYTCMNCKHTTDTRTCGFCNFSNPDNLLKPLPLSATTPPVNKNATINKNATVWYCHCGKANEIGTNECASCYAKRVR